MTELSIPTPHCNAPKDAFAKTVLMPGDPKRSKYIADTYLKNAVLVNDIRGVQGYTGEYKGKKVSVMASGMGVPSIGIYSYELYHAYNVDNIIRLGTAGTIIKDTDLRNLIVATGACTDSNFAANFGLRGIISAVPSFKLLKKADEMVEKLGFKNKTLFGQVLTGDVFYSIFSDGEVDSCVFYDSSFDTDRISMGNCFRTEEEAEFEVERLKVIHSMKRFTEPKNYAWDGINYHYYFYYDHHQGEIKIGSSRYYKYGGIYFEAEVNAQNCMNAVGEDRIKKYYFGIKEEDKEIAF